MSSRAMLWAIFCKARSHRVGREPWITFHKKAKSPTAVTSLNLYQVAVADPDN